MTDRSVTEDAKESLRRMESDKTCTVLEEAYVARPYDVLVPNLSDFSAVLMTGTSNTRILLVVYVSEINVNHIKNILCNNYATFIHKK